ncbi:MAG: hypothetical protein INQ03_09315 [Candidatus Heimdallarchaeota archaeon]|nr:hypothetical protein [Candidatus Heimdallarchaeota archaeon]
MLEILPSQKLVINFPYTNPIFLEDKRFLDWNFSPSILITAYSLLKQDYLVTQLQRSGGTLREWLVDQGFNPSIEIFADTGVFALEYQRSQGHEVPDLANSDIFLAYDLMDPDYLVAPDEIITLEHSEEESLARILKTRENLYATVDRFPKHKIYATIQGLEYSHMQMLTDTIKELKLKNAARGGLLPLKRNNAAFQRILTETEILARRVGVEHLHAFGLPGIRSLHDIFINNSYDSVDTTTIYYYTQDRKYINRRGQLVKVNTTVFDCDCQYCRGLRDSIDYPNSGYFMKNLFGHNATMMARFMSKIQSDPQMFKNIPYDYIQRRLVNRYTYQVELGTAATYDAYLKSLEHTDIHNQRVQASIPNAGEGILIISSCSKSKKYRILGQPLLEDLITEDQRKEVMMNYRDILTPAYELYTGWQHRSIRNAVYALRSSQQVDHLILSAGFGWVKDTDHLPPYDATFSGRTSREIIERGEQLGLKEYLKHLPYYKMVYIALSDEYLLACGGIESFKHLGAEIISFGQESVDTPVFQYSVHEFKLMEQQGIVFNPGLDFNMRVKGDILQNFAKSKKKRFIDWWHSLINCEC